MKNKKAQTTLFIIAAILIAVVLGVFIIFRGEILQNIPGFEGDKANPDLFLKERLRLDVEKTIDTIGLQGGYMSNPFNFTFTFSSEGNPTDISYLCYTQMNYLPCVSQEPMLINHLESEIKNEIAVEVENGFNDLLVAFEDDGYVVDAKYNGFNVKLEKGRVLIDIDCDLKLTKNDESTQYNNFKIIILSKFYDLALVAQEIASQEAKYCNFEYIGYQLIYPEFSIDQFRMDNSVKIYTIKSKKTGEVFRFAVRSCVIPTNII